MHFISVEKSGCLQRNPLSITIVLLLPTKLEPDKMSNRLRSLAMNDTHDEVAFPGKSQAHICETSPTPEPCHIRVGDHENYRYLSTAC